MQDKQTSLALAYSYLSQSKSFIAEYGIKRAPKLLGAFPAWYLGNIQRRTALKDSEPWITTGALAYLDRHLSRKGIVFEWGSGGSTIYYAKNSLHVTSVEHDSEWHEKVLERLKHCSMSNVKSLLKPPKPHVVESARDPATPTDYSSADETYSCFEFQEYAASINSNNHMYELISVDGRARPSCIAHAVRHVAVGGFLLLDNSDRDYYLQHLPAALTAWNRIDFPGPYKFSRTFGKTTIWVNSGKSN